MLEFIVDKRIRPPGRHTPKTLHCRLAACFFLSEPLCPGSIDFQPIRAFGLGANRHNPSIHAPRQTRRTANRDKIVKLTHAAL